MAKIAALLLALAACAEHGSSPDVSEQNGTCSLLNGRRFSTLETHECGITPNGTAQCLWHISFAQDSTDRSTFIWQHSDVGESGTCKCMGADILVFAIDGTVAMGTFDQAMQRVTWDHLVYVLDQK
jgi:hypothetical protein